MSVAMGLPAAKLRHWLLAPLASLVIGLLAACGGQSTPAAGAPDEGTAEADAGHIHGLGVDPTDGRLLIATHHGLFAAADGQRQPRQVGTSNQDVMGFSVVGPGHYIGSGHPGAGQDLPPNLGLIESRDGGKSWKNVSLLGEADFHVLQSSGARVYGFDGVQGLLVSGDGGRSWRKRTPPAGIYSLAVDPKSAERIVASTEKGLFVSPNGGRGWRPLNNELAGLLAWPAGERLYLLDGQGQVMASADAGASWKRRGEIGGEPAALVADGAGLLAALADGTVKRSTDGGATWTVRTAAP